MKQRLLLAFMFSLVWNLGFPQDLETRLMEDFKLDVARANHDTTRINLMWNIISYSQFSNPDTAIMYFEKAYPLAEKINYPLGQIRLLGSVSFAYIGLGNLPKALELDYKALEICERNGLMKHATQTLNAIVAIYFDLRDYEKSMEFQQKAHSILMTNPNPIELAYDKYWIGKILTEQDQLDSAVYYLKEAELLFQKLKYGADPGVYLYLGMTQTKLGNPDLAIDYYLQGLELATNKNDHLNGSLIYSKMSALCSQKKEIDSSIYFANKALAEAELMNQKRPLLEAAMLLSELYEPTDPTEALRYFKIAATAREGLFGAGNIQSIQAMVRREEQRQIEIEAASLADRNRIRLNILISGLITLLVLAFILLRYSQVKQKAKQKIELAYDQLKATQSQLIQSEKMASLGELTAGIAHEIQNPLNFVKNFSEVSEELAAELNEELEKGDIEEAKIISNDVSQNLQKISHHGKRASDIVKSMLEHSRTGENKKEPTDINKLADEYLRLAYHGLRAKDSAFQANFTANLEDNLPLVNVVPQDIGRVLLNLINNAFYAVDQKAKEGVEGFKPEVIISTKSLNDQVEIIIADNGDGIPEHVRDKIFQPFFTTKPTGSGTGLGLSMSYDIITKGHGGELRLNSNVKEGTEFLVILPV